MCFIINIIIIIIIIPCEGKSLLEGSPPTKGNPLYRGIL